MSRGGSSATIPGSATTPGSELYYELNYMYAMVANNIPSGKGQ